MTLEYEPLELRHHFCRVLGVKASSKGSVDCRDEEKKILTANRELQNIMQLFVCVSQFPIALRIKFKLIIY